MPCFEGRGTFLVKSDIKVVAFDCDGVMFDSREANRAYYDHLLNHFHRPAMTSEQLAYVHMHTVDESLSFLMGDRVPLDAVHTYRRRLGYLPFLKYMQMEPGLVGLLETLRPRFKTAVATNRTDTMAYVLAQNRIEHLFDLVVCAQDVTFPKPHPEPLNRVADHFAVTPRQVVYVGDSQVDETAARAAGMPFVAYRNPELKADHHIRRLDEMANLLGL